MPSGTTTGQTVRPKRGTQWVSRTVHGHLVDLRAVVLLNVAQDLDVLIGHKVDRGTLAAEAARAANAAV